MFLQYVPFCILFETVLFLLYIGVVNASSSIDNIVTCPKKHKRELDRARRAVISPEQKALLNKRRCDMYAQKNVARKLQMTSQEEVKRKESKKNYNRMVREHRANNLHPDSIAMRALTLTLCLFPLLHLNGLKLL
jgi:hypothetical protein